MDTEHQRLRSSYGTEVKPRPSGTWDSATGEDGLSAHYHADGGEPDTNESIGTLACALAAASYLAMLLIQ